MSNDATVDQHGLSIAWALSAPATLITTFYLVHDVHQHFPYHLLLAQVTIALAVLIGVQLHRQGSSWFTDFGAYSRFTSSLSRRKILCHALAIIFLFSVYQTLFHLSSPICLALVLGLAPSFATAIGHLLRKQGAFEALRVLLITICTFTIYWNDYRLTPNGITVSLLGLGAYVGAHVLRQFQAEEVETETTDEVARNMVVVLPVIWLCTLVALGVSETRPYQDFRFNAAPVMIIANAAIGGIALFSSQRFFASTSPIGNTHGSDADALLLPGLILVGTLATGHRPVISVWELAAFLLAVFDWTRIYKPTSAQTGSLYTDDETEHETVALQYFKLPDYRDQPSFGFIKSILRRETSIDQDDPDGNPHTTYIPPRPTSFARLLLRFVMIVSWVAMLVIALESLHHRLGGTAASANPTMQQPAEDTLDVVVAYYHESLDRLIVDLNSLFALPNVASLTRRVLLYSKSTAISTEELTTILTDGLVDDIAVVVAPLENKGQEGDTFLHHMAENWDSLADHTLFMQGEMHNPWYSEKRVESYFVPSTGFLSLWHIDTWCHDCRSCYDHSRWNETAEVITDLFASTNPGKECKDLVITYRGQFIASRARIHGNDPELYSRLRRRLDNTQVDAEFAIGQGFGYTLERLWGTVMHCPGGQNIIDRCPSMASGLIGTVGALEDCQCLDTS